MSTQSDYSLTRVAVTLLAALLLTAGTAHEAGAAGIEGNGDDVTVGGVSSALTSNAAPRPSLMSWPPASVLMPRRRIPGRTPRPRRCRLFAKAERLCLLRQ